MNKFKKCSIILISLCLIVSINLVNASDTLLDSNPTSKYTTSTSMRSTYGYSAGLNCVGMALVNITSSQNITSVKFYLAKSNSPTGKLQVFIVGLTGTIGTNAYFNYSILAISDYLTTSTLTTSFILYEFNFTKGCLINANEGYGIMIFGAFGGLSDFHSVLIGMNGTASSHYGNRFIYLSDSWSTSVNDLIFYVYGKIPDIDFSFQGNATINNVFSGYSFYGSNSTLQIGNYVLPTSTPISEEILEDEFNNGLIIGIVVSIAISLLLIFGLWRNKK